MGAQMRVAGGMLVFVAVALALHGVHLSEKTEATGLLADPRLKRGDYFGSEGKLSHLGVNTVGKLNDAQAASKGVK
ncbi:hypothetical protein T484DRAFT_1811843 [Baffinella frigidus]|nr:hypothetical protein T484DRAFT_1811843 [Cryptophyta sp. CCMP2293]